MTEPEVRITGLSEFYKKVDQVERDITGQPMASGMARATLVVTRAARINAPVDRGPLRASIVPKVIILPNMVQGVVGSNKEYAPFQELGTRPYWAPWSVLYEWALRKTKGNVARAGALAKAAQISIARRGIIAKRFLQNALVDNAQRIYRILGDTIGRIVRR